MGAGDDTVGVRLAALFGILGGGFIGAFLPILTKFFQKGDEMPLKLQHTVKILSAIGAGVVVSTAMLHLLPDAIEDVTEGFRLGGEEGADSGSSDSALSIATTIAQAGGSLNTTEILALLQADSSGDEEEEEVEIYPYAELIAMVSLVVILFLEHELTRWLELKRAGAQEVTDREPSHEDDEATRASIRMHVFELAMGVHSVVIGFALGAMTDEDELKTLAIAISVHQLCEGFAVGSLVVQAPVRAAQKYLLLVIFVLTAPVGVAFGMMTERLAGDRGEDTRVAVQGVLGSCATGILLYMALCDMLPHLLEAGSGGHTHGLSIGAKDTHPEQEDEDVEDEKHHPRTRSDVKAGYDPTWLRCGIMLGVGFGAAAMAVLAKWA